MSKKKKLSNDELMEVLKKADRSKGVPYLKNVHFITSDGPKKKKVKIKKDTP